MVSGKNSIFLIAFVLLIMATAVSAALTISLYNNNLTTNILHPQTTVLIVLIGFLYISFVINRRLRSVSLTAPLSPDRMQLHSIPAFDLEISKKYNWRKSSARTPRLFDSNDSCRLHSDDEKLSLSHISIRDKYQQERNTKEVPQLIITHFSPLLNPALIRVAPRAELKLSFSPGFIFVRLPRGPPNPT